VAKSAISHADWRPRYNPYLIAATVTLATFMEVLDSSIANVALPHIAGSVGATYEESTWVLTSYLVSSAIVLPVSGWLSTIFGRKRFYMLCVTLFTICSLLCGLAPSLPFLIIARILQGAGGGGLQPSEQAILADTFSEKQRGMAFALYGMAVVVAPAVGPTLGGWITDNFNWHWIFFINIPIGLLSLFLTSRLVEDPPWLKQHKRTGMQTDYVGLGLIVLAIGTLQFVLDKGQESNWFASPLVLTMFSIGLPALVAFFLWEWHQKDPIVDVRLLRNRNFGIAVGFSFVLGTVLFGSTVLIPQFMQTSLGYTAERAGMALSASGIVLMFMMPVGGFLTSSRIDPRILISIGFVGTAFTLHRFTNISLQMDFGSIVTLRAAQVLFLPLIFIPITTLNYVGVPREKNNQVSGLSNFARNLGGSVGTSLLTTFLARQNQIHQVNFASHTSRGDANFEQWLNGLTRVFVGQGYDLATATQKGLALAYATVQTQANTLSFQSSFWVMSVIVACLAPLPFIMRRPKRAEMQAASGAH
jgi:DHA2 family multidrug resistance protein